MLREAFLINGMLFNVEAWYGMTKKDIEELEEIDKILLRKILSAHSKTPVEALYLELGCLPIRYILICRRLMFLHYLLTRKDNDILTKFFQAQEKYPTKNDWTLTVIENLKEINLDLQFNDIKKMKKETFGRIMKRKVREKALLDLMLLKRTHSKLHDLNYSDLELQTYLKSNRIYANKAKELFKFRTRMAEVKVNFKGKYGDNLNCPMGCNALDTQQHLLQCEKNPTDLNISNYKDLFSSNISKNIQVIDQLVRALKNRETETNE